jgi:hypothetical protein
MAVICKNCYEKKKRKGFGFLELNATFNNILVISQGSVLLVEETGVPDKTTG